MYPSYLEYFRERDSISLVDFDYDRNLFEFEQNSALPVLKGRLRSCLSYWHTIGANSFVIDTIKFGYRIPFISTPCQARFSNNQSALNNASFVESAIAELVHTRAVVELPFIPHVVNPLSVSIQSSGKKRLILDDCLSEIFFWKNNIVSLNTRAILPYNAPLLFSYSDASNVACGAFVVGTNEVSHRMWTACEAVKSSTWRELKAIQFALSAFKDSVRDKCVKWHSDSQGAVRVVEIGSPSAELHSIALDIFYFCRTYNITLIPQWVPRELNACADAISHIVDFDDWYTTPEFFTHLDRLWGLHTVDRFANAANAHLPRFNSRFRVPGTEAVDAFSISWYGENNWLVPPVHCITRVVQHLLVCGAVGTLVVPYWPSNVFWPFLFANAIQFQPYVLEYIHFPDPSGVFCPRVLQRFTHWFRQV